MTFFSRMISFLLLVAFLPLIRSVDVSTSVFCKSECKEYIEVSHCVCVVQGAHRGRRLPNRSNCRHRTPWSRTATMPSCGLPPRAELVSWDCIVMIKSVFGFFLRVHGRCQSFFTFLIPSRSPSETHSFLAVVNYYAWLLRSYLGSNLYDTN